MLNSETPTVKTEIIVLATLSIAERARMVHQFEHAIKVPRYCATSTALVLAIEITQHDV